MASLSSRELSLRRMASALSKEQVEDLLVQAALKHADVEGTLEFLANQGTLQRKLYVRGLAWDTTSEALLQVFSQYGEVEEGAVVTEKVSGRSRGFGFVTFRHMQAAHRALEEPSKKIDGRMTLCVLAAAGGAAPCAALESTPSKTRSVTAASASSTSGSPLLKCTAPAAAPAAAAAGPAAAVSAAAGDIALRKLYITGLSFHTQNDTFLSYFGQWGEIEEGSIALERDTRRSRGFGFVTYKTAEAARRAMSEPCQCIDCRRIQVRYALPQGKGKAGVPQDDTERGAPAIAAAAAPVPAPASAAAGAAAVLKPGSCSSSFQEQLSTGSLPVSVPRASLSAVGPAAAGAAFGLVPSATTSTLLNCTGHETQLPSHWDSQVLPQAPLAISSSDVASVARSPEPSEQVTPSIEPASPPPAAPGAIWKIAPSAAPPTAAAAAAAAPAGAAATLLVKAHPFKHHLSLPLPNLFLYEPGAKRAHVPNSCTFTHRAQCTSSPETPPQKGRNNLRAAPVGPIGLCNTSPGPQDSWLQPGVGRARTGALGHGAKHTCPEAAVSMAGNGGGMRATSHTAGACTCLGYSLPPLVGSPKSPRLHPSSYFSGE